MFKVNKRKQFVHDCDQCQFVVSLSWSQMGRCDYYLCKSVCASSFTSLILRFSDEGGDYTTMNGKQLSRYHEDREWEENYRLGKAILDGDVIAIIQAFPIIGESSGDGLLMEEVEKIRQALNKAIDSWSEETEEFLF